MSHLPPPPHPPAPAGPRFEVQNLLLGLGTALVAVAIAVFTAVNWRRLDASAQGLVLVALTAVATTTARTCAKRSMPATAEALGIVAILLALADVHALRVGFAPTLDPRAVWAGGVAAVAAGAWRLGSGTELRGPRAVAAGLGQLPLVLGLLAAGADRSAVGVAVLGQAALVALVAVRGPQQPPLVRRVAGGVAATLGSAAVLGAVAGFVAGSASDLLGAAAVFATASALGGLICWLHADDPAWRDPALAGSTVGLVVSAYTALSAIASPGMALAGAGLVAVVVMAAGSVAPKPWRETPTIVGGIGAGLSLIPLLASVASMLVAASEVPASAWALQASSPSASLQLEPQPFTPGTLALTLATLALLMVVSQRLARSSSWLPQVVVVAVTGLSVAPLLVPLSIGGTAFAGLAVVVGAAVAVVVVPDRVQVRRTAAALGALGLAWASIWALATPELTATTLGIALVAAAMVAITAVVVGDTGLAVPSLVTVVGSAAGLAGVGASLTGARPSMAWALAGVAGAVVGLVVTVLLERPAEVTATEVPALVVHLAALYVTVRLGDVAAVSVVLATGVLALALHATRTWRPLLLGFAAVEALGLTWLRLDAADVRLVEAYTLPLALVLLGAGLLAGRASRPSASWTTIGPALVVAMAPTTYLALVQPGTLRPLLGLVAGALVLVAGAVWSRRAAVDVGAGVVMVLGLRQLAPVVGELPNWATIGSTGVALLAVGATFEQRRRDLRVARRRYSSLR